MYLRSRSSFLSHEAPDQAEENCCQSNELAVNISAWENQLCQETTELSELSVWFCYQY